MAGTAGSTIGPSADSAYAVEPVGVATISVGAHPDTRAPVDRNCAVDHASQRTTVYRDIVQRFSVFAAATCARQCRIEHRPRFLDVVAVEHRGKHALHIGKRDVGQEAQPALIDADQRHTERCESARGQHGPSPPTTIARSLYPRGRWSAP
jgi:hypothetical protein